LPARKLPLATDRRGSAAVIQTSRPALTHGRPASSLYRSAKIRAPLDAVFAGQLDRALANKKPAGWMTADGSKFLKSAEPATGVTDIRKGPGFRMQQRTVPPPSHIRRCAAQLMPQRSPDLCPWPPWVGRVGARSCRAASRNPLVLTAGRRSLIGQLRKFSFLKCLLQADVPRTEREFVANCDNIHEHRRSVEEETARLKVFSAARRSNRKYRPRSRHPRSRRHRHPAH
jgi:hypothetical protein